MCFSQAIILLFIQRCRLVGQIHVYETFNFLPVTETSVQNVISILPRKQGIDIYGLHLDITILVQDLITPVLVKLFNKCLSEGVFPDVLSILFLLRRPWNEVSPQTLNNAYIMGYFTEYLLMVFYFVVTHHAVNLYI